jgi:hypothetical protein
VGNGEDAAVSLSSFGGEGQGEEVVALSQHSVKWSANPLDCRYEPKRRERWWASSPQPSPPKEERENL